MELTWRERLRQEPEWEDFARWPFVDTHALSSEARHRYHTNARIVANVLDGHPLNAVARTLSVSPSWVSQLMNRCLAGEADAPPALTQGLIPHRHLRKPRRKTALGTLTAPSGDRCSFEYVLETAPGLKDDLVKQIRRSISRNRRSQNLTPRRFHARFIAQLIAQDWPRGCLSIHINVSGL